MMGGPFGFRSVTLLVAGSLFACANQAQKIPANATTIEVRGVKPSAEGSPQQLILHGIKFPADVIGARVFLNPKPDDAFTPDSGSYVGSFFASHPKPDGKSGADFALTLHRPVVGAARIVVEPIESKDGADSGKIEVKAVEIRAVSNSTLK